MSRIEYRYILLDDTASYLDDMQLRLGTFFDLAVNQCNLLGQRAAEIFVDSGLSRKFELRTPKYVAGMSGTELLEHAFRRLGIDLAVPNDPRWPTSPDYWTGYTLPCFQVATGCTYRRLFEQLTYDEIRGMHYRYQERTEDEFVQAVLELVKRHNPQNRLRQMRKECGITQSSLAATSRVSLRSIQLYEQGEKDINRAAADTVRRLALALHCSMEDLLG